MSNDCCKNRPNFGRPTCVTEWGDIVGFVLSPLKYDDGSPYSDNILSISSDDLLNKFYATNPSNRWFAFPTLENVEYVVADSLVEEGASGRKSFLKKGKITLNAESWDKDGTSVLSKKMAQLRCADWGLYFITSNNILVGRKVSNINSDNEFAPVPLDSQSVDPKFMFKTNSTTQKVMFTLDLDRNFDDGTYYAIPCDELWDNTVQVVKSLDLQNLPSIIDAELTLNGSVLATGWNITINDDYRQGARNPANTDLGNVTGLGASNFLITNLTDATTITPTSVTEQNDGNYAFIVPIQSSADKIKVELVIASTNELNYNGSIEFLIP